MWPRRYGRSSWPMPSSGRLSMAESTVEVADLEVAGDGEPVLFVPGFPFGAHVFRRLLPAATGRFRTIVPRDLGPPASVDRAEDLRSSLTTVGIERCAVIAHGTGARVAQALAFGGGDLVD